MINKYVLLMPTFFFFCKEFQSFNEALFFSFFSVPRQIDHLKMFDFDLHKNIKLNFNSKTEKKKFIIENSVFMNFILSCFNYSKHMF